MGLPFLASAQRLIAYPATRLAIVIGFLLMGVAVALVFPDTPDEVSRIEIARSLMAGGDYNFFWPPGNVLTIRAILPWQTGFVDDVTLVRLSVFFLSAAPICLLLSRTRDPRIMLVALFAAPYVFLVLSTASQQGFMIGLFAVLAISLARQSIWFFASAALALYLVNPSMILALPLALLLALVWTRDRFVKRALFVIVLLYLPMLGTAVAIWLNGGPFAPALALNGPLNLFLGNNPDPLAHRGVGDLAATLAGYGLPADGSFTDAVRAYVTREPWDALSNMLTKAALYWMPWDHLRSGLGGGLSIYLFCYFGAVQIAIYALFLKTARRLHPRQVAFAVGLCLTAWAVYTGFFVKVRFRVPFDMLLLLSCMTLPMAGPRPPRD